jgi:hypothetical protein
VHERNVGRLSGGRMHDRMLSDVSGWRRCGPGMLSIRYILQTVRPWVREHLSEPPASTQFLCSAIV